MMHILFSFMPLITMAIVCILGGALIISHDRDLEREAQEKKRRKHKHKIA